MNLDKPTARISMEEVAILLNGLRDLYIASASPVVKRELKCLARVPLYVASETRRADFASESALKLWAKNKIVGDLLNLTIGKQRGGKKKFPMLNDLMLEHCNPLSNLVDDIFDDNKNIKAVLKNGLKTAWITKDENRRLNSSGYRSERYGNWRGCYKDCGIEIKD